MVAVGDGDGFVRCGCGDRHWGIHGAAGLLLTDPERGVLLQHRAWWTHHGGTWALPGGAVHSSESPLEAALREAGEEAGILPVSVRPTSSSTVDHGKWFYTTVLADIRGTVKERRQEESAELRWVQPETVTGLPLHHDFAAAWPALREQLGRRLVLVVDAANVVGSRPDGWWRDRAGATARLRDRLAAFAQDGVAGAGLSAADPVAGESRGAVWTWWPLIIMVVEGRASGVEPVPGVEVVAAERDGDTAIVAATADVINARPKDHVLVVTADRELRASVSAEGAGLMGPGALLGLLDAG